MRCLNRAELQISRLKVCRCSLEAALLFHWTCCCFEESQFASCTAWLLFLRCFDVIASRQARLTERDETTIQINLEEQSKPMGFFPATRSLSSSSHKIIWFLCSWSDFWISFGVVPFKMGQNGPKWRLGREATWAAYCTLRLCLCLCLFGHLMRPPSEPNAPPFPCQLCNAKWRQSHCEQLTLDCWLGAWQWSNRVSHSLCVLLCVVFQSCGHWKGTLVTQLGTVLQLILPGSSSFLPIVNFQIVNCSQASKRKLKLKTTVLF